MPAFCLFVAAGQCVTEFAPSEALAFGPSCFYVCVLLLTSKHLHRTSAIHARARNMRTTHETMQHLGDNCSVSSRRLGTCQTDPNKMSHSRWGLVDEPKHRPSLIQRHTEITVSGGAPRPPALPFSSTAVTATCFQEQAYGGQLQQWLCVWVQLFWS